MKQLVIAFLLLALLSSCGKKENQSNGSSIEDSDTTALTGKELFGAVVINSLLLIDEDDDLQEYLETEIYPIVSKSKRISANRESSTMFSVMYEEDGTEKTIIINKYYDAEGENVFFERTEPQIVEEAE